MRLEITKAHEGKTIFALPTGNNARGPLKDKVVKFLVVKVKRKYADLLREGFTSPDSYDPKSGATQSAIARGYSLNAGYEFYETLEDIERHQEYKRKLGEINDYFRSFANNKLTDKQVSDIHAMIYS